MKNYKKHVRKRPIRLRKYPPDHLLRIYKFIEKYRDEHDFLMPSTHEVARRFKTHHSSVTLWYGMMEEQGMLKRSFGRVRAIRLLPLQENQPQEVSS